MVKQDAEAAGASSGPEAGPPAELPSQAQPAAKRKREETFAWDSAALSTGTSERSFEEVTPLPYHLLHEQYHCTSCNMGLWNCDMVCHDQVSTSIGLQIRCVRYL